MENINYDTIIDYINGELTAPARLAFEKEMQQNKTLADEVSLMRTINNELPAQLHMQAGTEKLSATLSDLNKTHFENTTSPVKSLLRWWYAAAAAAAIVIGFFLLWPSRHEDLNNEALFAMYMNNAAKLPVAQRGNSNDSDMIRAATLYNNNNYKQALPMLQRIILLHPEETELVLATGICYLQTNQYDKALPVFDSLAAGQSIFKDEGTWYKALTFLKQRKPDECSNQLKVIQPGADRFKEAQTLMDKINNTKR